MKDIEREPSSETVETSPQIRNRETSKKTSSTSKRTTRKPVSRIKKMNNSENNQFSNNSETQSPRPETSSQPSSSFQMQQGSRRFSEMPGSQGQGETPASTSPRQATADQVHQKDASSNVSHQPNQFSDDELKTEILRAIQKEETISQEAKNINVEVSQGVVTLTGSVHCEPEKMTIGDKAAAFAGFGKVNNELNISEENSYQGGDDV